MKNTNALKEKEKAAQRKKYEQANTQEFGNPSGGVEPSYKQDFPRSQRLRCTVVKCSAISYTSNRQQYEVMAKIVSKALSSTKVR